MTNKTFRLFSYFIGVLIGAVGINLFLNRYCQTKITTIDVIDSPVLSDKDNKYNKNLIATIGSQINQLADTIEKAEKDTSSNSNKAAIANNRKKISGLYSDMAGYLNASMLNFASKDPTVLRAAEEWANSFERAAAAAPTNNMPLLRYKPE
jgi:hypothetical protein